MLIQILQSKGQLLTSEVRPIAEGMGQVEQSLKLAHSMPNREACGGAGCYSVMAPEKRLPAWSSMSLCVVIDQPVGNPKRKV
jgi:hypothetical protein